MNLNLHLELGSPLIWVNSDEPERVIDDVILQTSRNVFRLDPFLGLVVWRNEKWCKVLVALPDGSEGPTYDFNAAFGHAYEQKGVLIIPNAHLMIKDFLHIVAGLYSTYRQAFLKDDADDLPPQLVLISCTGEIPPEISRHVAVVDYTLPGPEELAELLLGIDKGLAEKKVLPEKNSSPKLTKAGLGLSEAEFMQASYLSIKEKGFLDHQFVNKFKMDLIKSGGVLEIRNPQISLDDIGGLDNAKDIIKSIEWTWENPEEAAQFGIIPIRRMLMIGLPGTGKSAICEATANTLGLDLAKFGVSSMMSKWIGESEKNMRLAFRQVRAMAPLVCWADELGRDLSGAGTANDSGTTDRVHGEFLTGLQELPNNVLFMAAANRIDGIPPEMLRADRFDKILFVGYPSIEERVDIFNIFLGERKEEFDVEKLADATPLFTGAEIKSLIQEVKFKISGVQRRQITTEDILAVAPTIKNRLWIKHQSVVIDMYKRALDEWDWASTAQQTDAGLILSGKITSGTRTMSGAGSTVYSSF